MPSSAITTVWPRLHSQPIAFALPVLTRTLHEAYTDCTTLRTQSLTELSIRTPCTYSGSNPFTPKLKKYTPPFKLLKWKCLSDVVRIGSVIISHLGELWKAKFLILCDVIFLVRLQGKFEIDHSLIACGNSNCIPILSFLAKRGVKDEICSFDARKITPDIRASVEELLEKNPNSFDDKVRFHSHFISKCLANWPHDSLHSGVGVAEDKLVYQLCVDEGNGRRERHET